MNQEILNKYRAVSIASSGYLILWYFFDVDISKIDFLKEIGLQDQQVIAYILLFIVIFCIVDSFIEFLNRINESWHSKFQILIHTIFGTISIFIAYPKLTENTFLHETGRLDVGIPIIASFLTAMVALEISVCIQALIVFFRFRRKIFPSQAISLIIMISLVVILIASTTMLIDENNFVAYQLRYLIFAIAFVVLFILLSPKENIFSKDKLVYLEKLSASLDRQVETSKYVSTLEKTISAPKKKIHKKTMKLIKRDQDEQKKSIFPRYVMLHEISFKEYGENSIPFIKDANDEDPVIKVNFINKNTDEVLNSEYIKFKYVKLACKRLKKINYGNDIRGFLTPMASLAYSMQTFHESDKNELMLKFASSGDGYLKNLKALFNTRDPDINFVDPNGWTSLLLAVANGEEKTVEYLLQKAANPLLSTKHGASPLHFAAMYGNLSLCKLLIRYQADVNQVDMECLTPLMLAAKYGHQAVVNELINHGANLNTFDINKKTALDYAVEGRYGEICKILRKYSTNK